MSKIKTQITMDYDFYNWSDCTFPQMYCEPLYRFLKTRMFKHGLEIGFDSGSSALVFLAAQPHADLTSVDIRPLSELRIGDELLAKHGMTARHTFVQGDSHLVMPMLKDKGLKYDYIYVDGDHLYDGVFRDLQDAITLLAPGGVIVVDDCILGHGVFGVHQAVKDLLAIYSNIQWDTMEGHINKAAILTLI